MHHGAAREVYGSHLLQEAAAPYPVCHGEVGDGHPQQREHHVALELHALGEGSEYQGRRDEREHALEHGERELRYARRHDGVEAHAVQERLAPSAYECRQRRPLGGVAVVEGPAVAERHPQQAHRSHDEHGLHDDAEHVLLAHQSAVEQRDAWYAHEQHEDGGHGHPGRVAGVERGGGKYCRYHIVLNFEF